MFVPFIFTLDTHRDSDNYFHWLQFYWYSAACITHKWPIITHERYFKRLSHVEQTVFGVPLRDALTAYCVDSIPTTEDMLALKTYPISQNEEDKIVGSYSNSMDCWTSMLKEENQEFEHIIGSLLDKIIFDFGEKPEGILTYEYLPKALLTAAITRGIKVIFQAGGVLRPPFAVALNAFSLINNNSHKLINAKYESFLSDNADLSILSRKGILRLFASEQHMMHIQNIDFEPAYDIGVLQNNLQVALLYIEKEKISDQFMTDKARAQFKKVLIRTRPGFEKTPDALDDSLTCFQFCCKCKRILGFASKGVFEAMLAGRIAHEYGSSFFNYFCNNGVEDESIGIAPIEYVNFILFGLCTPFTWLTNPDYLRFLLSGPTEKDIYLRSFKYYTRNISQTDLEFYYTSDNRAYRLGDPLYFSNNHLPHQYASFYCKKGLQFPSNGILVWSMGDTTEFEFDMVEQVNEALTLSIALYEVEVDWSLPEPIQTVTCKVNDTDCGSVILKRWTRYLRFTIPKACFTNRLQITLQYGHLLPCNNITIAIAFKYMSISIPGTLEIEEAMFSDITTLSQAADTQVDTIATLTQTASTQANEIVALSNKNSTQADEITVLSQTASTQSNTIAALAQTNSIQGDAITALTQTASAQANEISMLSNKNSAQADTITSLTQATSNRVNEIAILTNKYSEQAETIATLMKAASVQTDEITALTGINTALTDENINQLNNISALNELLSSAQSQITSMKNSKSWRITKPLRFVGRLVRKK